MKSTGKVTFGALVLCLGIMLVAFSPGTGRAIPQKINYQGYLTTQAGVPINETLPMVFSLYDVPSSGTALWTEQQNVTVINGIYNVSLGDTVPIPLAFNVPYYLGIAVGSDPEMMPRKALASVGYAFRAMTADVVGPHTHSSMEGAMSGGPVLSVTNTGIGDGVRGFASSEYSNGLYGSATGTSGAGVAGYGSGTSGIGVYGGASNTGDVTNYGGLFSASGTYGLGVYGTASGTYGQGLYGSAAGTSGVGVRGRHSLNNNTGDLGTGGEGVYGVSTTGDGVKGESYGSGKSGVYGLSHQADGYGVYGGNWGGGYGVYGSVTSGTGVFGYSNNSFGMFARSQQGVGLSAVHSGTGNYAHIGTAAAAIQATGTNGNAIEAYGDLHVTGAYKGNLGPNGAAPFPRPAYDSSWVDVPSDTCVDRDTGLHPPSYSNDNFFIKMRVRSGFDFGELSTYYDVWYSILSNNSIHVCNGYSYSVQIRLWIWYVK